MALSEPEHAFVDQVGRFYTQQYGIPPTTGRVAGYLLICEPPAQTAADVADALGISRSAVGGAVSALEKNGVVRRTRLPGERADRIVADGTAWDRSLDPAAEYVEMRALAERGLEALGDDASPERRARLVGMIAFADFLIEESPKWAAAWRRRRAELEASGELP